MIGFCVDPPQENAPSDVDNNDDRWKTARVRLSPESKQLIRDLEGLKNSVIKKELKKAQEARPPDLGSKFITTDILSFENFTFVMPDYKNRILRKNGGGQCEKLYQLFISCNSLELLLSKAVYYQKKHILCNMLHPFCILYVVQKDRPVTYQTFLKLEIYQYRPIASVLIGQDYWVSVFGIHTSPILLNSTISWLVVLSPDTTYFTKDRTIVCSHHKLKNIKINIDKESVPDAISAVIQGDKCDIVSENQTIKPLKETYYISYNFLDPYFHTAMNGNYDIIVFGDSVPYSQLQGTWDEELEIVNKLSDMCNLTGVVIMTSTYYLHEGEVLLAKLADTVNTTLTFKNRFTTFDTTNDCYAELVSWSPTNANSQSVVIKKRNIGKRITFDKLSPLEPKHAFANELVTSEWPVSVTLHMVTRMPKTTAFIKNGVSKITIAQPVRVDKDRVSITYSAALDPGTYDVVFGLKVGEIELDVELPQQIQISAAAAAVADGGDGGSRLFRSGKLLDMMLQ